ncbi:MAG: hypothetical protein KF758_14555 [Anaerolineales bacterium]|nr:hypothetical protein [Anaerolineales bacterium]
MNRKKRPALFFVFTALFVIVCRCGPDPFDPRGTTSISLPDGSSLGTCKSMQEFSGTTNNPDGVESRLVWDCTLTCPDGSQVVFQADGHQSAPSHFNDPLLKAGDSTAYLAQYCSPEAMVVATSTQEPVATATATSTPQEQVIVIPQPNILILQPVLAGTVSACDTGLGYINLPLADPMPDLTGKELEVIINGYKVNCAIAGSRNQLLACSLPPEDRTFPLNIGTTVDSVQVDSFSFDGATCTNTVPTKEKDPNDPDTSVVPTSTPVDCIADPYNPACP